jgi:hypothetical protein
MRAAGILGRVLVLSFGLMGFASGLEPAPAERADNQSHEAPSCVPRALCCKMCEDGKACGNACISRSKSCHKGSGCACDAHDICA